MQGIVLVALMAILSVAVFVLKGRLEQEQIEVLIDFIEYVAVLVGYAENLFGYSKAGKEKKAWVEETIKKGPFKEKFSPKEIDKTVENAVDSLNKNTEI